MTGGALSGVWFALIAVIWLVYLVLEGFDFGVGVLLPFLGATEGDRRALIATIGPIWDGNEVWLIVAGGATFAAFPAWYAALFSGFYPALLVVLLALILRAVAFEFRGRRRSVNWRRWWDRALFFGSALPPLVWGIAFANLVHGVPLGPSGDLVGSRLFLLQPYGLLGGVTLLLLCTLHGAAFATLRTTEPLAPRARRMAHWVWPLAAAAALGFLVWTYADAVGAHRQGFVPGVVPVGAAAAVLGAGWLLRERRMGWMFVATGAAIVLTVSMIFLELFPRVMVSDLSPRYDLTIYNASSSAYTLGVMSIVAAILVPVVIAYQAWSYWVFRGRVAPGEGYY